MTFEEWHRQRALYLHAEEEEFAVCWNDALKYYKSYLLLKCCTKSEEPLTRSDLAVALHDFEEYMRAK